MDFFPKRLQRKQATVVSFVLIGGMPAASASPIPVPTLKFQSSTSSNGKTYKVVIGQQIIITADQVGTKSQWTIKPSAPEYQLFEPMDKETNPPCPLYPNHLPPPPAPPPNFCVSYGTVELTGGETQFYFVEPGSYTVSYKYTESGQSAKASVKFDVEAPNNVGVSYVTNKVQLLPSGCTSDCKFLSFGDTDELSDAGIILTAEATPPPDFKGKFVWVQMVDDGFSFVLNGHSFQCPTAYGLDNNYPYKATFSTTDEQLNDGLDDSPSVSLHPNYTHEARDFTGLDVLMWQASETGYVHNPVPVGIGLENWGYYSSATYDTENGIWTLDADSGPQTPTFTAGLNLPGWNSVYINSGPDRPPQPKCVPQ